MFYKFLSVKEVPKRSDEEGYTSGGIFAEVVVTAFNPPREKKATGWGSDFPSAALNAVENATGRDFSKRLLSNDAEITARACIDRVNKDLAQEIFERFDWPLDGSIGSGEVRIARSSTVLVSQRFSRV